MKRIRKLLKTETALDVKVKLRARRFSLDPSFGTKSATVAPLNLPPQTSVNKSEKKLQKI